MLALHPRQRQGLHVTDSPLQEEALEGGVLRHDHVLVDGFDIVRAELDRGTRSLRGSGGSRGCLVLLGSRAELEESHVDRDVLEIDLGYAWCWLCCARGV